MSHHLTPPARRKLTPAWFSWPHAIAGGLTFVVLSVTTAIVWPHAGEPNHQMRRVHVTSAP